MKTSETIDLLATALAQAQGEMQNAAFNRENPHFKSAYADLAAIREATIPALSKYGLSIVQVPTIIAPEDGLVLVSRLMHKSGQWIEAEYPVGGTTPQARGSELTYARRYSWSALTGIAADADDDGEVAEASAKNQRGASEITRGEDTLSKAKSKPVYEALVSEMRTYTQRGTLQTWGLTNSARIHLMHKDYQKWFLDEYKNHRTAIEEGVNEEGETIGEKIDDEIPEQGVE